MHTTEGKDCFSKPECPVANCVGMKTRPKRLSPKMHCCCPVNSSTDLSSPVALVCMFLIVMAVPISKTALFHNFCFLHSFCYHLCYAFKMLEVMLQISYLGLRNQPSLILKNLFSLKSSFTTVY